MWIVVAVTVFCSVIVDVQMCRVSVIERVIDSKFEKFLVTIAGNYKSGVSLVI
jgi:hypothetical protein